MRANWVPSNWTWTYGYNLGLLLTRMETEEEKRWRGNAFGTEERTKVQQGRRTQFGVHLSGWPDSFIFSDYVTLFLSGGPFSRGPGAKANVEQARRASRKRLPAIDKILKYLSANISRRSHTVNHSQVSFSSQSGIRNHAAFVSKFPPKASHSFDSIKAIIGADLPVWILLQKTSLEPQRTATRRKQRYITNTVNINDPHYGSK